MQQALSKRFVRNALGHQALADQAERWRRPSTPGSKFGDGQEPQEGTLEYQVRGKVISSVAWCFTHFGGGLALQGQGGGGALPHPEADSAMGKSWQRGAPWNTRCVRVIE